MVKPYTYHVFVCTAEGAAERCLEKGGEAVRQRFFTELGARGVQAVKVTKMGCTLQHKSGPIVVVYPDGIWYARVTPDDVPTIIDRHLMHGEIVEELRHYTMSSDAPCLPGLAHD